MKGIGMQILSKELGWLPWDWERTSLSKACKILYFSYIVAMKYFSGAYHHTIRNSYM